MSSHEVVCTLSEVSNIGTRCSSPHFNCDCSECKSQCNEYENTGSNFVLAQLIPLWEVLARSSVAVVVQIFVREVEARLG